MLYGFFLPGRISIRGLMDILSSKASGMLRVLPLDELAAFAMAQAAKLVVLPA
jgi:hypothetical protein